jgi:hypothetical protein
VEIRKQLSANDLGLTGSHQAGILVPKDKRVLSFFPALTSKTKNPRTSIVVRELADDTRWEFNFIYYNNRLFGGTRNEYRLTCMTAYLRAVDAREEDSLVFSKNDDGSIFINLDRQRMLAEPGNDDMLVLSGGWRVIDL